MKAGWYHNASDTHEPEIRYFKKGNEFSFNLHFQHGPFKRFAQAKADCIAYYRCDLDHARYAVRNAKALRKPKA